METNYKVYGLYDTQDPTQEIRYIGITSKTIKHRLNQHLYDAKTNDVKTHKTNWMNSVTVTGGTIGFIFIDDGLTEKEAGVAEMTWIEFTNHYLNMRLTNGTLGGEGTNGYWNGRSHKQSTKEKMSAWQKGKPKPQHVIEATQEANRRKAKRVVQLNLDGSVVRTFASLADAANAVGVSKQNISNCCNYKPHCISICGYLWQFEKGFKPVTYEQLNRGGLSGKPVIQIAPDGTETRYSSLVEARKKTGVFESSIRKCCQGKNNRAGGYKWKYETQD